VNAYSAVSVFLYRYLNVTPVKYWYTYHYRNTLSRTDLDLWGKLAFYVTAIDITEFATYEYPPPHSPVCKEWCYTNSSGLEISVGAPSCLFSVTVNVRRCTYPATHTNIFTKLLHAQVVNILLVLLELFTALSNALWASRSALIAVLTSASLSWYVVLALPNSNALSLAEFGTFGNLAVWNFGYCLPNPICF